MKRSRTHPSGCNFSRLYLLSFHNSTKLCCCGWPKLDCYCQIKYWTTYKNYPYATSMINRVAKKQEGLEASSFSESWVFYAIQHCSSCMHTRYRRLGFFPRFFNKAVMNELSLPNKDRKRKKVFWSLFFMPTYLPYKRTCNIK